MSSEYSDYEEPGLFNKGFSRNWNDIDLRKRNTYGQIGPEEQANSDHCPDLDYEDIEVVDDAKGVDCLTDHLEMEEPEDQASKNINHWQEMNLKAKIELMEALSEIPIKIEMDDVKSNGKAASEHTPNNKQLISNELSEIKKFSTTMAQSRETLKEKVDDISRVKQCLNRKDVVIKSILRSMRKYYSDLIQDNSEYKRKIRNISLKHKTLVNCALDLANALCLSETDNNVAFYLTAVAFPTDLRKILKKTRDEAKGNTDKFQVGLKAIDKIENAMTRYSKKVMKDFMDIPEICFLLLNYLAKVHNQEYEEHYKFLKDMANDSLDHFSKVQLCSHSSVEGNLIELIK